MSVVRRGQGEVGEAWRGRPGHPYLADPNRRACSSGSEKPLDPGGTWRARGRPQAARRHGGEPLPPGGWSPRFRVVQSVSCDPHAPRWTSPPRIQASNRLVRWAGKCRNDNVPNTKCARALTTAFEAIGAVGFVGSPTEDWLAVRRVLENSDADDSNARASMRGIYASCVGDRRSKSG